MGLFDRTDLLGNRFRRSHHSYPCEVMMTQQDLEEFAQRWFESHENKYEALRLWGDAGMKAYREPATPPDLGIHVSEHVEAKPIFGGK